MLERNSHDFSPGQWARALCINDNLNVGTILPYLDKCKEAGYSRDCSSFHLTNRCHCV